MLILPILSDFFELGVEIRLEAFERFGKASAAKTHPYVAVVRSEHPGGLDQDACPLGQLDGILPHRGNIHLYKSG